VLRTYLSCWTLRHGGPLSQSLNRLPFWSGQGCAERESGRMESAAGPVGPRALASDKLFFSLFQDSPDLVLRWLHDLPPDAGGYRFSAPVLKEREYRLDGLFSPPEQRNDLPAVILEAQMAADPAFLLRLYAESARFLQQERWPLEWQVVVICPHRQLNFGPLTPVREFVDHRVIWVELQPRDGQEPAEPLTQVLSLLVQPELRLPGITKSLRHQAVSNPLAAEALQLIPAILLSRFNDRPIREICAMGGITIEDFTQSRAYQEIFGQGQAEGEARGKAEGKALGETTVILRLLNRR
jgi:predicted transposase YdaD